MIDAGRRPALHAGRLHRVMHATKRKTDLLAGRRRAANIRPAGEISRDAATSQFLRLDNFPLADVDVSGPRALLPWVQYLPTLGAEGIGTTGVRLSRIFIFLLNRPMSRTPNATRLSAQAKSVHNGSPLCITDGGCPVKYTVSDMSGTDSKERSIHTASVMLAVACAAIGLAGVLFEKSFVVGRRGFGFAEGGEAQIIGCFWLLVAAAFLATRISNSVVRKRIFALITVLLFGSVFGIFGYFIYALR